MFVKNNSRRLDFPIDWSVFPYLLKISVWPFSRTCYTYFGGMRKLNEYCKQHDYDLLVHPLYEQDNTKFVVTTISLETCCFQNFMLSLTRFIMTMRRGKYAYCFVPLAFRLFDCLIITPGDC